MSGTPNDDDRDQANAAVMALTGAPVAQLVFNNVLTATTPTEIMAALMFGQRPLAVLIMNPIVAKSFAHSLLARVADYETLVGHEVRTIASFQNV